MRIIFAGTPDFSVSTLEALVDAGHEILAVYTQPDRKVGRGQKIIPSAVKKCALEHKIQVRQPLNFKNPQDIQELEALQADVMIVVAYGLILPQALLGAPKHGCLNIHASLLPRWRGAAPIQRSIEAGDEKTGVCIMQMDAGLDTGDVLLRNEITIEAHHTSQTLHDDLAILGAKSLIKVLADLSTYQKAAKPQDNNAATYAEKIRKDEANIDWRHPAQVIHNKIRAFNPWPICQTFLKHSDEKESKQRWRIWSSAIETDIDSSMTMSDIAMAGEAGQIVHVDKEAIYIACGKGSDKSLLKITQLQKDGSKAMPASDFINGNNIKVGLEVGFEVDTKDSNLLN
jgi:methionyl-tRNA formyltransferase